MSELVLDRDAKVEQKFDILVIYNGVEKKIEVNRNETIKSVLERAIHAFGQLPNPHMLSLWTSDGRELNDAEHVGEAGIKPHDRLLLRPGQVKGGQL